MNSEVLTVQSTAEGLTATGMPENQANAVLQAIAKGVQFSAVMPARLKAELAPIKRSLGYLLSCVGVLESRINELSQNVRDLANEMHAGIESINSRIFWLIMAVLGTMSNQLAATLTVPMTNWQQMLHTWC